MSLFDGMACGMIAMQLAGGEVESYDAYEIDKYAIKTAQHNFPMIKEHGDVFGADFTQYEGVDFLIGGSPCTYWSIAQTKNRETVASGMGWELFSQYVRALCEAKPKYSIYENNKSMSKQIRESIDATFGFEAVLINSALVSAQNRQRLYWVGKRNEDGTYSKVPVEQPEDRGILLRDILETGVCWRAKSYTLDANYYKTAGTYNPKKQHSYSRLMAAEPLITTPDGKPFCITATECKGSNPQQTLTKHRRTMVAEPIEPRCVAQRGRYPENPKSRVAGLPTEQMFEAREDGKTNTLTTVQKDNLVAEPICVNSKSGRSGVPGLQPSLSDRIYSIDGKATAVTTAFHPNIAEPIRIGTIENDVKNPTHDSQQYRVYSPDGKGVTLCGNGGGLGAKTGLYATPVRVGDMPSAEGKICGSQSKRIYSIDGKAPSICATETGGNSDTSSPATRLYAVPTPIEYSPLDNCDVVITDNNIRCSYKDGSGTAMGYSVYFDDVKSPTVISGHAAKMKIIERVSNKKQYPVYEVRNGLITIKGKQYPIKLKDGYYIIRKLTVRECMRLQTVPEWYEFPVSDSQAYKMLGNGWTCEVIAHLIRSAMAQHIQIE